MTECHHGTPSGPERCALCRQEEQLLHDPYADHRSRWSRDPDRGVPMPDYVRDVMATIRQSKDGVTA